MIKTSKTTKTSKKAKMTMTSKTSKTTKMSIVTFQHRLEKRTGQTCTMRMKRLRDTSGTYRLVSMVGFEKFGKEMGELDTEEQTKKTNSHKNKQKWYIV